MFLFKSFFKKAISFLIGGSNRRFIIQRISYKGDKKPDPRVDSSCKIAPPAPLPHVSRRALKRIPYCLDKPLQCPCCEGGSVSLEDNKVVYGYSCGHWPYIYLCNDCGAYVGLHPHTDIPLGTLAQKKTRFSRMQNMQHFLLLQNLGVFKTRTECYQWLADEMKLPTHLCQFALFDSEQAKKAGDICKLKLENL